MSTLQRRISQAVDDLVGREVLIGRRPVPPRVEQAVNYGVAIEHGRGIVRAAQIRAVGYDILEAVEVVAQLSDNETRAIQRAPLGEARYKLLVDTGTAVLANIIAEAGRE